MSNSLPETELPRLLYFGDVPVEASYHGSALLFRLLQSYPIDRLRIVEAGITSSLVERRLPGVTYSPELLRMRRLLHTRFGHWVSAALALHAPFSNGGARSVARSFSSEAVLTVAHGFSWMSAARYARGHHLPLHLIIHDDWPRLFKSFERVNGWVEGQFARCYRQAESRLCVSPYMAEEYAQRYGADADVLYPSRAAGAKTYPGPPSRLYETGRPLVYAFGGTINTQGHVNALAKLANVLVSTGDVLNIYGPVDKESARNAGLLAPNVRICGMVPASDFVDRIRNEADVLFLPMSFIAADRSNARLCFPSKLTEYTAAALPLLVYGPADSSANRWVEANPGVAESVTEQNDQVLREAILRLHVPLHRHTLAVRSQEVGKAMFSHETASCILRKCISARKMGHLS